MSRFDWKIYRVLYAQIWLRYDDWKYRRAINKRLRKAWKDFGSQLKKETK